MRFLAAFLIFGCAASSSIRPYSWTPFQEYTYKYSTQVLNGIPELSSQFSGLRLISTVRIQPKQDYTLTIRIEEPKIFTYNDVIEWTEKHVPKEGHVEEIPSEMKSLLENAFTVFHKHGTVEKIEVNHNEPEYIVNLKKGLVSQLLFDLSQTKIQDHESMVFVPVFKTNETTILGECETSYTISKLPEWTIEEAESGKNICKGKEHYEILKTKNLESCSIQPVYHRSFGAIPRHDSSNSTYLPQQSSLSRTIICGTLDDYIIKNITTENNILSRNSIVFENKEKVHTSTFSTLEIESVYRVVREIPNPLTPKSYPSLVFGYPHKTHSTTKSIGHAQVPLPDLESAPITLHNTTISQEALKEKIVNIFINIIETSKNMTKATINENDVASLSITASKILSRLSLKSLKEVEQTIKTRIEREGNMILLEKVFFDLVSMAGTNPCVMLIKEKIVSGDVIRYPETWAWIISNTMRTIRTPTKELIEELVELLKTEHIERNRIIRAAYVMGLTELIHKACVNPLTFRNEYPYRIYGQMCYKDMPVIKDNLIPYLSQKLYESSRTDNNTVITFINALGNIGTEESTEELLKVIEGKIPTPTYPKALAVYMLIKPALLKPSIYKPIFLSIIENPAEHSDVKQNAIFGLVSSYPSSTDLQRLALRTWFEPSRQTVSLIHSTLKSLTQLSGSNPEYERLRIKAQLILPMTEHVTEGYQYSHNYHYTSFVENLRTLVSHRLAWTSTEESFIPSTYYNKIELKNSIGTFNSMETNLHMEGFETVISKLIEIYSELVTPEVKESSVSETERETREKFKTLGVQNKKQVKPEAHLTLRYMGLQKLYSFNEEIVKTVIDRASEITENGDLEKGIKTELFKILDLHRTNYILPTESGMPVYISFKTPAVIQMKGGLRIDTENYRQDTIKFEGVSIGNYKEMMHYGVKSELMRNYYGVGVERAVYMAAPIRGEVMYDYGQVQVTVEQSKEPEFQREQPIFELDVHPFTTSQSFSDFDALIRGKNVKTIKSQDSELKKEVNIGKPIGLDINLKIKTEELPVDTYKIWNKLQSNAPIFVNGVLPIPITTIKRSKLQLFCNPTTSETKKLDLHFTVGYGSKSYKQKQAIVRILNEELEEKIQKSCKQFAPKSVSKCKLEMYEWEREQDSEIVQFCKEEERTSGKILKEQQQMNQQHPLYSHHQQRHQSEQLKVQQQLHEECLSERHLCKVEKKWCMEKQEKKGLPRTEVENVCGRKLVFCTMKSKSRHILKSSLSRVENGTVISLSFGATLRTNEKSKERKIETHIALSHKNETETVEKGKTHITLKSIVESPILRKPYEVEIEASTVLRRPISKWSIKELMKEDLTSKLMVVGLYGSRGEERKAIKSSLILSKSKEQEYYIQESPEYEECSRDESEGRLLTGGCEQLRTMITSLDKVQGKLYLPVEIAENKAVELTSEAIKIALLPFMNEKTVEKRGSGHNMEYEIELKINGTGKLLNGLVSGNGKKVEIKNIRLGNYFTRVLPISTRYSLTTTILQKLTNYTTPSTCTIESGKVMTFDKMNYAYYLNDCEHVVFTELSTEPRILISTKRTPQKQHIKMIVDGHKYEVVVNKESRYSRNSRALIKIDEHERELETTLENLNTIIKKYVDGVYSIYSRKYGVEVIADGERLEVKSNPLIFGDRATGLCGDLNGEWMVDLKSPKQCVIPVPKLTAMTFMLEDGKCRGIPQPLKPKIKKFEQRCIKKEFIPTKVEKVFESHVSLKMQSYETELKHIFEQIGDELCVSKEMIRVCSRSYPKEIFSKRVPFICLSGPHAKLIKSQIIAGEHIEDLSTYPTKFIKTVFESRQC